MHSINTKKVLSSTSGDEPDESRGTRINLALSEENRFHLWAAKILNITEHTVNRLENGTINDALNNNPKDKKKKKKKEVVEEAEEDCTYYEMKIRLFTPPTCIVAKWRLNGMFTYIKRYINNRAG